MKPLAMMKVRQHLPRPRIEDVPSAIIGQLERLGPFIRPGMSVALTAGSRGINGIPAILRTVVTFLRDKGAKPYIVASMGSHGGGTAEGQARLLQHLGITEESIGAPLRITAEAIDMGVTPGGHTLYADAEAAKADGILVINRIKPHTAFRDNLASGLYKMLTVGLGKVPGATQVHKLGHAGMYNAIIEMGRQALQNLPVLGGLAIVENGYEETAHAVFLLPGEMEEREPILLKMAASYLPRLPVQELDLLIVEEMGKNFSGTGMDTNVIGRWRIPGFPEPELPRIKRIAVLRLSDASEGNANGIGLADFTTRTLAMSIDWNATLLNVQTTGFPARAFCPPFPGNDLETIERALESLKLPPGSPLRIARISNTLHIEELWLSPESFSLAKGCTQIGQQTTLVFDQEGNLLPGE